MLYLARRRGVGGFSHLVVLKLVHSHLLRDANITRLFLEEARISANVAHPNVVSVEEIGQIDGSYFITMEYVHGLSLSELLAGLREKRLRMSAKLCVWLTAQIAEALHAVHETTGENGVPLQIVHRDVSPQNVLVGHTGHVKLIDFGIAKSCSRGYQTAGTGPAVLGKLGYMAPEQLRSEPADRRTDVYALGVMLWEMLAARSLFRCKSLDDERDWAAREAPPAPSKYTTVSSQALDRVVVKALAFSREQRHLTALEFRTALLRAEPSAAQIDAPMFAAMLRTLLGGQLERLRSALPSEISLQLARDAEVTTFGARSAEGLTAHMSSDDVCDFERPEADERTADTPSATPTRVSEYSSVEAPKPLGPVTLGTTVDSPSSTEAETAPTTPFASGAMRAPTEPAPTYLVESPRPVLGERKRWVLRAGVGLFCLTMGIAAGAVVSGFKSRSTASAHASDVKTVRLTPREASGQGAPPSAPAAASHADVNPGAARSAARRGPTKLDQELPSAQRPTAGVTFSRPKRSVVSARPNTFPSTRAPKGATAASRKNKASPKHKLKKQTLR